MIFCLLFAFLYGVGAIFILVWNASVLGAAIGVFAKTQLSGPGIGAYIQAMSLGQCLETNHRAG